MISRNLYRVPFHRRFVVRLTAGFFILISAALAVHGAMGVVIAEKGFERTVIEDFRTAAELIENSTSLSAETLRVWAQHYATDDMEISRQIAESDPAQRDTFLSNHFEPDSPHVITVLDRNGNVLFRHNAPMQIDQTLSHLKMVWRTLATGKGNIAIANDQNRFILYAAEPLIYRGIVVGVIMVGRVLDHGFAEKIKGDSAIEITIIRDRAVMGSTIVDASGDTISNLPVPYLEYRRLLDRPDQLMDARFLGKRFIVKAAALRHMDEHTPGSLFLAVSRDRLDRIIGDIVQQTVLLALIFLVVAGLISILITTRLTRTLEQLTGKVIDVAAGRSGEVLDIDANDEVGVLAKNIAIMQETIAHEQQVINAKNEELMIEKESAEFANRAKTDFLAHMSHELRTPLNAIIGFADTLKLEIFGPHSAPQYKEYASNITYSGNHLLELLNEILDLTQIESNQADYAEEDFYIGDILTDVDRMVLARAESADVRIKTATAEVSPVVRADRRHIKQILLHLVTNAIKFTPKDGTVTISATETADDEVCVSVCDTGCGIAPENLAHIFEPFWQGRDSAHQAQDGTGLGLSISQKLAELNGARLTAKSTEDVGTTFYLHLRTSSARPF